MSESVFEAMRRASRHDDDDAGNRVDFDGTDFGGSGGGDDGGLSYDAALF